MKELVKLKFGSTLYGTRTESSDTDYKGIFLPDYRDLLLAKIKHNDNHSTGSNDNKNNKDDIDTEWISIHKFINDACNGQTYAFDMLHTPTNMYVYKDSFNGYIWDVIIQNREKFYSKNIHAFVGYSKGQAAKYSLKGSRLNECKIFWGWLNQFKDTVKVQEIDYSTYPTGNYISFVHKDDIKIIHDDQQAVSKFIVCEKEFQISATIGYAKSILESQIKKYGKRAIQAENNNGIDFKAYSHCFRILYEVKQMFTENTITFPLSDAKFITDIKLGKYTFKELSPMLEDLLDEVEDYKINSNLPEKVDRKYWDELLFELLNEYYR